MTLDTIQSCFDHPPPIHLNAELAVCFVLSVLLAQDTYAAALIQHLVQSYPAYRLSKPNLYKALTFLETEGAVLSYWQKVAGRGRPRRMFTLVPPHREPAAALVQRWHAYMQQHPYPADWSTNRDRYAARSN